MANIIFYLKNKIALFSLNKLIKVFYTKIKKCHNKYQNFTIESLLCNIINTITINNIY